MSGGVVERWHGTTGGYGNHKCRCEACRAAWRAKVRQMKAERASKVPPDHVHGTTNGYGNYGCRCVDCTRANAMSNRRSRGYAIDAPYRRRRTPEEIEADREAKAQAALIRQERRAERLRERAARKPRLRKSFEDRYIVNPVSGCWEWQGKLSDGRGSYKGMTAHRWSYLNAGHEIPDGYQVRHLCQNSSCVNPQHLEAVSGREVLMRSANPSWIALREGVCSNGHPFVGENVRTRWDGRRECVQCNRDRCKRYRARKRATPQAPDE